MPNGIDFVEETAPQSDAIDFQSDETLAATAVQVPQAITGTVNRLLQLGGPGAEMARKQTEADEAAQRTARYVAGGGPGAGMALIPPVATPPQVAAGFRYGLTIPGRVANALLREERLAGGQGIAPPPPQAFGETDQEYQQRKDYPLGAPGEQLYIPQTDQPSDVQRWIAGASTIDDLLALPLGTTRTGGKILLATMLPGVAKQLTQLATGPGDAQDKLQQARDLVVPALVGLAASRPAGMELFPRRAEVVPGEEPAITGTGELTPPPMPPLEFAGAALPGRPAGAIPTPEVLMRGRRTGEMFGPPAPPIRPEVPETAAGAQPTALEEIRANNAQTTAQVQRLFPQLSREEAAQLRNLVWGKPGAAEDVGVVVSPTIPRPTPMEPPRGAGLPAPEIPIRTPLTGELTPAELEQQARDRGAIGQQIITWERELDKAIKNNDAPARAEAIRKLTGLRLAYEGPPATTTIRPKPGLPALPRRVTEGGVPGTPAEPRETALETIRKANARTRAEVQALFPDRQLTREEAGRLRNQAWGIQPPPEPPAAPPSAPQPPTPPAPPAAPAAAAPTRAGQPTVGEVIAQNPEKIARILTPHPPAELDALLAGLKTGDAKLGSTEAGWKLGNSIRTPEQLQALKEAMEAAKKRSDAIRTLPAEERFKQFGNLNESMFLREAYEAATGTGSAFTTLSKVPGYKPPMPERAPPAPPPQPEPEPTPAAEPTPAGPNRQQTAERLVKEGLSNEDAFAVIAGDKTARQAAEDWIRQRTELGEMEDFTPAEYDVTVQETVKRFQDILEGIEPDIEVTPAKPATLEQTVIAGKTLAEWEAIRDASQLPKGDQRAELAKWLAVPNQPSRILQALANKKRTREIHAPPAPIEQAAPVAEPTAPIAPAPEPTEAPPVGELFNVPQEARTGPAARAYIIRRLEELEDINPQTGEAEPKEDLTEAQEKARKRFREMLNELEQQELGEGQGAARWEKVAAKQEDALKQYQAALDENIRLRQERDDLLGKKKRTKAEDAQLRDVLEKLAASSSKRRQLMAQVKPAHGEIDQLIGGDPKLEDFARNLREDFDAWVPNDFDKYLLLREYRDRQQRGETEPQWDTLNFWTATGPSGQKVEVETSPWMRGIGDATVSVHLRGPSISETSYRSDFVRPVKGATIREAIDQLIAEREAEVTAAAEKAARKGKRGKPKAAPIPEPTEETGPTVQQIWKQVNDPEDGVGITAQDAANAIMDMEAGTTTEPLVTAAQKYLDAIEEDMTEYGGRSGLAEDAQEAFLKALEKEAGETTTAPLVETKPSEPERIVAPAVKNPDTGKVAIGPGQIHAQLYPKVGLEAAKLTAKQVEAASGYWTSRERFVTQAEGDKLALQQGLIKQGENLSGERLQEARRPTVAPPAAAAPPTTPVEAPPAPVTEAPPAAKTRTAQERSSLPQPTPEAEALRVKAEAERAKLEEMVSRLNDQARRALDLPRGSPEWRADQEAGQKLDREIEEQRKVTSKAEGDFMDARIQGEFAKYRGMPQPEPSEPKITNKVLKAQKEDLMGQLNQAIKDAPAGRGTEKITIQVEGDGEFTLFNGKEALTKFRDEHAKFFPETVGGTGTPKVAPAKGKAVPKLTEPAANDLPKIAGAFVSDDPSRFVLQTSYADGTQIIATDGRQMMRIVGPSPGTPAAPVRLSPEGKIDTDATGKYPNYNQVRPTDPTLVKSGASTDELWKLARQAQVFLKDIKVKDEPYKRMNLFINKDGSLGAKASFAEVGSFEHNVKPDAYFLGTYNADYIANGVEAARRLGNEKIDLYAADTTGPLVMVGKNHEYTLMAMRTGEGADIRQDPAEARRLGAPEHRRPAEGYGPLSHPEEYNARQVEPAGGQKFNIIYEDGKFKVQQLIKGQGKYGSYGFREDRWEDIAELPFDRQKALPPKMPDISAALEAGLKRKPNASEQTKVRGAIEELIKDRQNVIAEGQRRTGFRPELAGPGSPAYGQGPDNEVLGLDLGSPAWNRIKRQYDNFYAGLGQLFKRRGIKRDLQSVANAANNLPKVAGLRAGDSVRVRTNEQEQNGIAALMQSLKMSGEGLSVEAADRLGQLEFAGDPTGYLQSKQTDMETLAQRFRNQGKMLEAQAAAEWAQHLKYARENFNRLKPLAEFTKRKFDRQLHREQAFGIDTAYEHWYVPQRHEIDLMPASDRPIVLGDSRGAGPSSTFKKAKVFEDYASAIEAGFIPRTFNIADLLEHRVAAGEKLITGRGFFDQMREIPDPVDGKPIVIDIPRRIINRPDGSVDVQENIPVGYKRQQIMGGSSVAVHEGYARLVDALTARSQLSQSAIFGTLQNIAAVEKHLMLALDTFHASRTMQAEFALTGKLSIGARQRLGRALVEYSPSDLDAAVQKGEITQEMADWIRTPQQMNVNGQQVAITPHALINLGIRNGLNIARFGDVLYKDWLREMPYLGAVNKWVFDKLTRSAMAHGFLAEFERIAAAKPELNGTEVARQVARDINVLFGNLGKESIFRNPSLRSITQVLFLAPQWVEALARREGRAVLQVGEAGLRLAQGKPAAIGTAARTVGTGLALYFVGTQLLNLITRQQLTFQNKERGHKLDAWIPGGKNGYFISPLSVFAEITHDILRYAETKPDLATAVSQVAANKLGNLGRFLEVLVAGRDPVTSEKIVGTGRRAIRAGVQLAPFPIIGSNIARVATEGLPAALPSFGVKTEPAGSAQTQVFRMVDDWKRGSDNAKYRAEVERRQKEDFGPSDYRELRTSLGRNDLEGARRAYDELRQSGKTPKTIRQTLQHPHPFTGSASAETRFRASLNPDERELYNKAIEERRQLYHKFQEMLQTRQ